MYVWQRLGVEVTDSSPKYVCGCPTAKIVALFLGRGETEDGIGFTDKVGPEDGAVSGGTDITGITPTIKDPNFIYPDN